MSGVFSLKRSGEQFLFTLKAGRNFEVLLTGERSAEKAGALWGVASVRTNARTDERYQKRVSLAGEPYFVLRASNGEVLGTSEMYASAAARELGMAAVKRHALAAALRDHT